MNEDISKDFETVVSYLKAAYDDPDEAIAALTRIQQRQEELEEENKSILIQAQSEELEQRIQELEEERDRLALAVTDFWVYIDGAPILDIRQALAKEDA